MTEEVEERVDEWRTKEEVNFLHGLGSYAIDQSRVELLTRYLEIAVDREHWGSINRDFVIGYAMMLRAVESNREALQHTRRGFMHSVDKFVSAKFFKKSGRRVW